MQEVTENKEEPPPPKPAPITSGPIKAKQSPIRKGKYIPPMLRKKMQQEAANQGAPKPAGGPASTKPARGTASTKPARGTASTKPAGGTASTQPAPRTYTPRSQQPKAGNARNSRGNNRGPMSSNQDARISKNNKKQPAMNRMPSGEDGPPSVQIPSSTRFNSNINSPQTSSYNSPQNKPQQNSNRFRRDNLNSGFQSPPVYNPSRRAQGYGQNVMRRQRSAEYQGRNTRFSHRGDRSTEANPVLEQELYGDTSEMSAGINFDIYDTIPVEVSGKECPAPALSFNDPKQALQIPAQILANIGMAGFTKPTPVQRYSIPAGLARRDIMSCAQTGSGKTAAFLVPIISGLITDEVPERVKNMPPPNRYGRSRTRYEVYSLVLSPTRELAQQIHQQARKFLYRTGLRSCVVYGGADIKEQFRELDRGAEVLVATPGRLVDFLDRGRMTLNNCFTLCFDEADRMLDMGFEPQIRQIVERYDMPTKHDGRQTMMFSATFPKDIQVLAQDFLKNYIFLAVGRVGSSTDLIEQKIQYVQNHNKVEALMDVLPHCNGLTLIFVATRRDADRIENILIEEGVEARSIHGDRTQWEREEALKNFRSGKCPVLVATDVAARGLDIPNVMWVINYDLPNQIDAYVHRIGRTGRCGNKGSALSFVNETNKPVMRDLMNTLRECESTNVPQWFVSMVNNLGYGGDRRPKNRKKSSFGGRDVRSSGRGNKNQGFGGGGGGGGYGNRQGGGGGAYGRKNNRGGGFGGGGGGYGGRSNFGNRNDGNRGGADAW